MARILAVGIATLDVINEVATYPEENSEQRALWHGRQRGGNATNTLVVLSQLGHHCAWAGVLPETPDAAFVQQELHRYRIDCGHVERVARGTLPTSYVTLSRARGSRTIVHTRDLPEFSTAAFQQIPLAGFDWLHFEGRDPAQVVQMMRRVRELAPGVRVSLEVEKPRPDIETLFPHADLITCSQAFAARRGVEPVELLRWARARAPEALLVCTLGEQGVIGLDRADRVVEAAARPPDQVVDTLGAGDTFNAGLIDALVRGEALTEALGFACRLAGVKCAQRGLHGLPIPPERVARGG